MAGFITFVFIYKMKTIIGIENMNACVEFSISLQRFKFRIFAEQFVKKHDNIIRELKDGDFLMDYCFL